MAAEVGTMMPKNIQGVARRGTSLQETKLSLLDFVVAWLSFKLYFASVVALYFDVVDSQL